jgi:hypothetical protein
MVSLVFCLVFAATQAKAEIELGSLNLIANPNDSSPIPCPLFLGGIAISSLKHDIPHKIARNTSSLAWCI